MEKERECPRPHKFHLPIVTEQEPQTRIELKPSNVPVLPFIKQNVSLDCLTLRKKTTEISAVSSAVVDGFNVLPSLSTVTDTAENGIYGCQRRRNNRRRYRLLSEPLTSFQTAAVDIDRNFVIGRRHKSEQLAVTDLPPIDLPLLRGLDNQQASGWMYHSRPGASSLAYLNDLRSVLAKKTTVRSSQDDGGNKPMLTIPPIVIDIVQTADRIDSSEESKATPDTISYSENLWPAASDDGSTDCAPLSDYTMGETSPEPEYYPSSSDAELTIVPEIVEETAKEQEEPKVDELLQKLETSGEEQIPKVDKKKDERENAKPADPPLVTTASLNCTDTPSTAAVDIPSTIVNIQSTEDADSGSEDADSGSTEIEYSTKSAAVSSQANEPLPLCIMTPPFAEEKEILSENRENETKTASPKTTTAKSKKSKPRNPNNSKLREHAVRVRKSKQRTDEEATAIQTENEQSEKSVVLDESEDADREDWRCKTEIATALVLNETQAEKRDSGKDTETRPPSREEKNENSTAFADKLQNERRKDRERRRIARREKKDVKKKQKEETEISQEMTTLEKKQEKTNTTNEERETTHHCLQISTVQEVAKANETNSEDEKERLRREEEEKKKVFEEMERVKAEQERQSRVDERRRQDEKRRRDLEEQKRRMEEQIRQEEEMRKRIRRQLEARAAMQADKQMYVSRLQMEMEDIAQSLRVNPPFVWSYYSPICGPTTEDKVTKT